MEWMNKKRSEEEHNSRVGTGFPNMERVWAKQISLVGHEGGLSRLPIDLSDPPVLQESGGGLVFMHGLDSYGMSNRVY